MSKITFENVAPYRQYQTDTLGNKCDIMVDGVKVGWLVKRVDYRLQGINQKGLQYFFKIGNNDNAWGIDTKEEVIEEIKKSIADSKYITLAKY